MTPEEYIDRAVRQTNGAIHPKGAVCSSWVLVAEWQDADGRWWVTRWSSRDTPPWRVEGLLQYAISSEDIA